MKRRKAKSKFGLAAVIFMALALLLIGGMPSIVNYVYPPRSIGQTLGEETKKLRESISSEDEDYRFKNFVEEVVTGQNTDSDKKKLASILDVLGFIFLGLGAVFSSVSIARGDNKIFAITAGLLALIAIAIKMAYLAIGLIGFLIIAAAVLVLMNL